MKVDGESVRLDMHQKGGCEVPIEFKRLKPLPLIFIRQRNPDEFSWVRDGRLASGKMSDGAEFDSRADMVDHPGGKIRTFFRIINQKGDVGQAEFFLGRGRKKGRG